MPGRSFILLEGVGCLVEVLSIDDGLDGLLADLDQPSQFEALQQVNSLPPIFVLEEREVRSERRTVVLRDFLHQFRSIIVSAPSLLDQVGDLRLDSKLILEIIPLDMRGLLPDRSSCVLDDLGDLAFQLLLGR